MPAQSSEKKSAAERKEESAKRAANAIDKLNSQQQEAIADMLETLIEELPHTPEGDKITAIISKLSGNRVNIKLDNADQPRATHFEKIVLGVCRRTHIECIIDNKELEYALIKRKMYKTIAQRDEGDTQQASASRNDRAYEIYRKYYRKVIKARKSYRNSPTLIDLQEYFPKINVYRIAEYLAVALEIRRQRVTGDYAQWLSVFLRIAFE
jgi:hypothetical protein